MNTPKNGIKLQTVILLGTFILVAIIAVVISRITVAREEASLQRLFDQQLISTATSGNAFLQNRFSGMRNDLSMLTGIPPVPGYIRASRNHGHDPIRGESTAEWLDRLTTIFVAMMRSHPDYAKIRFIGVNDHGREIARVDQRDGKIWRVPGNELQQVQNSDYFQETIKQRANSFYFSAISLNREHGRIEMPPRPMVRAATPIHAADGELIGIMVINADFNYWSRSFATHFQSNLQGYLINRDGDFLWHPDQRRTFGFDLNSRFLLSDEFPAFDVSATSESASALPVQSLAKQRVTAIRVPVNRGQPEHDLVLLVEFPFSQLKPLLDASQSSSLISIGIAAALIMLFIWWAIRKALSPLLQLTTAAQAIAEGHYDTELPEVQGAELSALRAAFVSMETEVSRREAELREHRDNLEHLVNVATTEVTAIVQSAVNGIITIDERGIVHIFNPAAEKLFGWRADEVVGNNVSILMGQPHASEHDGYLSNFLNTGEAQVIGTGREITAQRKDGSTFPAYLAVGHAELSPTRHFFVAFLSDITLQKQREEELQLAKDAAEAAARTKSDFLANMSHEIRTPMNAILGLCYLLEKQSLSPVTSGMVQKIHGAGRSLLGIINDILDFSKIEAQRLDIEQVPFRLSDILDNLASIMSSAVGEKNIEVVVSPAPAGADFLKGDALRLGQVLINLAGNAIKFTQAGEVAVHIALTENDPATKMVRLRFSVCDTGIGIPKDKQEAIFNAFSQADTSTTRSFGGTGLGLTISRRLVELMGGTLKLNSEPGQGSEFYFELLFELSDPVRNSVPQMMHQSILIADDQDTAREMLAGTATSLGWRVETVASGEKAVAALADGDDKIFDIFLLDWRMPGLDGLSAAAMIREQCRYEETPIIIMATAFDRQHLMAQAGSDAVDVVLNKPVTASSLYNAVQEAKIRRGLLPVNTMVAEESTRLAGLRLLVVDDSEINREVAKRILEGEGAEVELAEDGSLALTVLNSRPSSFDVVLMDVQMPVMDGYTATRQLRATPSLAHLPVIALTAGAFKSHRDAAYDAGVNDFVAKPFDVDELIGTVLRLSKKEGGEAMDLPVVDRTLPAASKAEGMPGVAIDIARGLDIWRDDAVFKQYLRKFAQDYGRSLDELGRLDADAAGRFAHKLKGAAGNLALTDVAAQAGIWEQIVHEGGDFSAAAEMMRAALMTALAAIEVYAPAGSQESLTAGQPVDAARVSALLAQVLRACGADNPDAIEPLLKALEASLPGGQLAPLRDAVMAFDFRGAEACTRALACSINISLE